MPLDVRQMRGLAFQHPKWRTFAVVAIGLPAVVTLAVLAFAWPVANVAPRALPVGLVGTTQSTQKVVTALDTADAGGFDLRIYADNAAARRAIRDRDVYGAIEASPSGVSVLTSSAASPAVARLLSATADQLASKGGQPGAGKVAGVATNDVVAADSDDPQGLVLNSALLPLTICSVIIAAVIALLLEFGPAWRMGLALLVTSAMSGLGAFLIAEPAFGALPNNGFAAWGSLTLLLLAMSSTVAGLISIAGVGGVGLGAILMVFIGNPFSASTTAPELLPGFAHYVGQWLPPGAGANLLRSVTYFDGDGAGTHLGVLLAWIAVGAAMILTGHHSFIGFAARRRSARDAAVNELPAQHMAQPA